MAGNGQNPPFWEKVLSDTKIIPLFHEVFVWYPSSALTCITGQSRPGVSLPSIVLLTPCNPPLLTFLKAFEYDGLSGLGRCLSVPQRLSIQRTNRLEVFSKESFFIVIHSFNTLVFL